MLLETGLPNRLHRGKVRDTYRINDELRIALEIGEVFDRDVEFGRASEDHPSDVDIDDAFFFRFAILGPF